MSKLAPKFPWNHGRRLPPRTMLKRSNPYNAGYALPKNVLDESTSGGSLVTRQAKSGTISGGCFGGQGYAVPNYILKEGWRKANPARGLPRGTIANKVPNQFIGLGDSSLDGSSLDQSSLGFFGEDILKKGWKQLKSGAKTVGGLACKVSSNELAQKAGGSYVAMANGLCPKGSEPATPPAGTTVINQGVSPTTLMIGAAALVGLLLVLK